MKTLKTATSRRASRVPAAKSVETLRVKFPASRALNVPVAAGTINRLHAAAAKNGVTADDIAERAVKAHVEKLESEADAPRFLITKGELEELVDSLLSTIDSNVAGGCHTNIPKRILAEWQKQRATWVSQSMKSPLSPLSREDAEEQFRITDEAAVMLRRLLPIFAAA